MDAVRLYRRVPGAPPGEYRAAAPNDDGFPLAHRLRLSFTKMGDDGSPPALTHVVAYADHCLAAERALPLAVHIPTTPEWWGYLGSLSTDTHELAIGYWPQKRVVVATASTRAGLRQLLETDDREAHRRHVHAVALVLFTRPSEALLELYAL